ncbi:hypothetical protein [Candidatus Chromulinivorax destructor]|uniref:Uncharacterized protein n=1 Tax=Candidatus Chromulinivorax destructor TaxID=2066483 RepID=A0A345ZAS4_9BACT|nr:hypothetical protein [Candidatus Chromulinivorax destructor]AXK60391.1 hypothetical protein C0J27_01325 [Candidatus Chromulinivorax destructor]
MIFDWFSFIFGMIGTIITTFIGQRLNADNEAIILCRQDLFELEKSFKYINEHKTYDSAISEKIKFFEMHYINLYISYQDVEKIIKKSYEILRVCLKIRVVEKN